MVYESILTFQIFFRSNLNHPQRVSSDLLLKGNSCILKYLSESIFFSIKLDEPNWLIRCIGTRYLVRNVYEHFLLYHHSTKLSNIFYNISNNSLDEPAINFCLQLSSLTVFKQPGNWCYIFQILMQMCHKLIFYYIWKCVTRPPEESLKYITPFTGGLYFPIYFLAIINIETHQKLEK